MSRAQVEACAARLAPADAAQFQAQMAAAAALFVQAVELRRKAWQFYRDRSGLTTRGRKA
jgi:hypothetical protein